jgi:hypothetical protein
METTHESLHPVKSCHVQVLFECLFNLTEFSSTAMLQNFEVILDVEPLCLELLNNAREGEMLGLSRTFCALSLTEFLLFLICSLQI